MAELSTIARPYAEGLWQALTEHDTSAAKITKIGQYLETLAEIARDPQISELVNDPKLTVDQVYEVITGAAQYRALKNESEGVADAYIETAFPLDDKGVKQVIADLSDRFPGLKLNPIVTVNPALIGGVSVTVGDQIIDISVRTRLKKMQAALTA